MHADGLDLEDIAVQFPPVAGTGAPAATYRAKAARRAPVNTGWRKA